MSAQLPTSPWHYRPIESRATPILSFSPLSDLAETKYPANECADTVPRARPARVCILHHLPRVPQPLIPRSLLPSSAAVTKAMTGVVADFSSHEFSA
ncbi:hypothetical protein MY4824_004320 [Beauveria thailandica]